MAMTMPAANTTYTYGYDGENEDTQGHLGSVVTINTNPSGDVFVNRMGLYNMISTSSHSPMITLGRPSRPKERIRRGDPVFTDPTRNGVSDEASMAGAPQLVVFATLAGVEVDLNPPGFHNGRTLACRQNQQLFWEDDPGRMLSDEESTNLARELIHYRCSQLQFVGIALSDIRVGDGIQLNGLAVAVVGSVVPLRNDMMKRAKFGQYLYFDMPVDNWKAGGMAFDETLNPDEPAFDRNNHLMCRPSLRVFSEGDNNAPLDPDLFVVSKANASKGYYKSVKTADLGDDTTTKAIAASLGTARTLVAGEISAINTSLTDAAGTLLKAREDARTAHRTGPTADTLEAKVQAEANFARAEASLETLRLLRSSLETDKEAVDEVAAAYVAKTRQSSEPSYALEKATDTTATGLLNAMQPPRSVDVLRGVIGRHIAVAAVRYARASGTASTQAQILGEATNDLAEELHRLAPYGLIPGSHGTAVHWFRVPVFEVIGEADPGEFMMAKMLQ